jgi:hypothetical protein
MFFFCGEVLPIKNGYKLSTKAFYFYLYFFGKKGPKSPLFEFTQFGEFFYFKKPYKTRKFDGFEEFLFAFCHFSKKHFNFRLKVFTPI